MCDNNDLTNTQINLLAKGGKFTPVPGRNDKQLETDVSHFSRNLRLREFFHVDCDSLDTSEDDIQTTQPSDDSLVRNKSTFIPPKGRNERLDNYIEFISNYPKQGNYAVRHFNISKNENTALKQLRSNTDIIIKEADKGGALVVMPKDYYKSGIETLLSDESCYKKTTQKAEDSTIRKLKLLCTKHRAELTDKEADYLINFESKTSNIYGLPKVHKSPTVMNTVKDKNELCVWTPRPTDLPFRPIIAGPACPTHRLSNMLDIILKPLCKHIPSYLQDTTDFLIKLPSTVSAHSSLVTYDVINLYGSTPHDLGKEAITYWLNKHPNSVNSRFSQDFIIKGISLILENNVFTFGDQYYVQTKGTAMGTKVGPIYASLVMGYLETKLYAKINQEKGSEVATKIEQNWKRFLDDCFIIWDDDDGNIDYLTRTLNELHPDIQFTVNISKQEIPFLDVLVIKNGSVIHTDVYSKPTDTKNYLLFSSCHPRHVKSGIPKTLATRLITIVSNDKTLQKRLEELKHDLLQRGYPESLISHGFSLAKLKSRETLLQQREYNDSQSMGTLPLVTTHNPKEFNLYHLVKSTIDTLNSDQRLHSLVSNLNLINSKRQGPNLKSLLTRARFSESSTQVNNTYKVSKCNDPRCGTCDVLLEGSQYRLRDSGKTLTVKENMSCKSLYVIYVIRCLGCQYDYIGSTKNLRHRVALHKSQIKCVHNRNCPVSGHLADCAGGNFKIFPFFKIKSADDRLLRQTEFKLIKQFNPSLNAS